MWKTDREIGPPAVEPKKLIAGILEHEHSPLEKQQEAILLQKVQLASLPFIECLLGSQQILTPQDFSRSCCSCFLIYFQFIFSK